MSVLMLPMGHFAWLIAQSVQKDVAFSSLEVEGAKAVKDLMAGLAESGPTRQKPDARCCGSRVQRAETVSGRFSATAAVAAFRQALGNPQEREVALDRGQVAIQKIADGSNLTLDPEVTTYYLMDAATVRLPEVVIARALMEQVIQAFVGVGQEVSMTEYEAFIQASTRFDIGLSALRSSIKSAQDSRQDLGSKLGQQLATFNASADRLSSLTTTLRKVIASSRPNPLKPAEFDAAEAAFAAGSDALWQAVESNLVGLLDQRIEGLKSKAFIEFALALLGCSWPWASR